MGWGHQFILYNKHSLKVFQMRSLASLSLLFGLLNLMGVFFSHKIIYSVKSIGGLGGNTYSDV